MVRVKQVRFMKMTKVNPWGMAIALMIASASSSVAMAQASAQPDGTSDGKTVLGQYFQYPVAAVDVLVSRSQTVIGQPFAYPEGTAMITGAIITMEPGNSTGWHRHNAPLFGFMLEGEITVDYGPDGLRTYRVGDGFVEAFGTYHNGTNSGDGVARILAVFAGADGVPNTQARPE
jgi:quercetin dioxygenase-like cupin family protein